MNKLLVIFLTTATLLFSHEPPFVSEHAFKSISDFALSNNQKEILDFDPQDVFEGAIIYVLADQIDKFFREYHGKIKNRYVLITHGKDRSSPRQFSRMLADPKIIAWLSRNPSLVGHAKFHPLPIGVCERTVKTSNRFTTAYNNVKDKKFEKENLLYLNISVHDAIPERKLVYNLFSKLDYCYTPARKPMEDYLIDLHKSKFVLSPEGRGLDCYRTWEAIIMGSIPIVKTSPLDPLFKDLPVYIVKDWKEINEESLLKKYQEMENKAYFLDKLYISYWKEYIHRLIRGSQPSR